MSDEWQTYTKDPRTICKYGVKCYQTNPEHHKTYKHPPQTSNKEFGKKNNRRFKPYSRDLNAKNSDKHKTYKDKPTNCNQTDKEDEKNPEDNKQKNAIPEDLIAVSPEENKNNQILNKLKLPESLQYYDGSEHDILKELFLVEMPLDFFKFYECLSEDKSVEKSLASVNLEFIGPYDFLLGKLPKLDDKELFLVHWRFFYDPPEFQAVLKKKGKSQYHIGYFRDDPNEKPVFLASNDSAKDCHITPMAENIFGAVYLYLQNEKKTSPFTAMACQKFMDRLKKYADENDHSIEAYNIKKRKAHIVTNTFHTAGIVVPYDKKTQLGYRRLVETDANLRKIFTKLEEATSESEKEKIQSELQPVITYASIAVDECDFGTGLEVGIDLFCSGLKQLESSALSNLCTAYDLLNRGAFSKIIEAHLKYRRKGANMSLLSLYSERE